MKKKGRFSVVRPLPADGGSPVPIFLQKSPSRELNSTRQSLIIASEQNFTSDEHNFTNTAARKRAIVVGTEQNQESAGSG
ncbi:hypothetical protein [Cohnella caldifontis]|uniref:hypothetical protein n=1 Tax=Cohnella caldifontis TaxID=3027471 RepID=UPI0023EAB861|nr:hypothetical protein [Cohnella sp. YIM B05605]